MSLKVKGGRGNDNRSESQEGRGDIHHEILGRSMAYRKETVNRERQK